MLSNSEPSEKKEREDKKHRINKAIWWSIKWLLLITAIRGIIYLFVKC
jgi:hypothetical protein